MAPPTTRKAQKAATRRLLKEAALSCFAEVGLSDTSIGAITSRAGVAHGTFYVHFASKEELLDELLSDFNVELAAALTPVWVEVSPEILPDLIERTAEMFLDSWLERRAFVEAYAMRLFQGVSLIQLRDGINPPVATFLSEQLTRLAGDQDAEPIDVQLVAQALLAMWGRLGLQYLFNDDVDRSDVVKVLARVSMGALAGIFPGLLATGEN